MLIWRIVLVTAAVALALYFATEVRVNAGIGDLFAVEMYRPSPARSVIAPYRSTGEACYPYTWQVAERKRLDDLLAQPDSPPAGTDELALAQYAVYMGRHQTEEVAREGIRRDPGNALYHYYLADLYINKGIKGAGPKKDKATGRWTYDYTITDRAMLDKGMRELAIGLKLPFRTRRDVLLRAQLDAMPRDETLAGQLRQSVVLARVLFPEYSKARNFARVNGYYLDQLLAEGKRAEAEPFLHTGEVLAVQMANDTPTTLIGQLVALAISAISKTQDARICRAHGLEREATTIEARHTAIMGVVADWKDVGRKKGQAAQEAMLRDHGGALTNIMMPVFGTLPSAAGTVTADMLAPSRMAEYALVERHAAMALSLTALMLAVLAMIAQARRWGIARAAELRPPDIRLSVGEWALTIGVGMVLPVALYLGYISLPALSGRDHGLTNPPTVARFLAGLAVAGIWVLIVPAWLASRALLHRSIAAGAAPEGLRPGVVWGRLGFSASSICWAIPAVPGVWAPIAGLLLCTITAPPFNDVTAGAIALGATALLVGTAILPVIWERNRPEETPHLLAMGRTLTATYVIAALLVGGMALAAREAERAAVRQDQIMGIVAEGDTIGFCHLETRLVLALRDSVRAGAKQVGVRWEEQ